jgi:DNA-binding PadR family transcriptional regulator
MSASRTRRQHNRVSILSRMLADMLILEELRRAPAHGYSVRRALERSGTRLAPSTVYSTLRRLERDGIVKGRWQDGRRRRVYRITRLGDEVRRLRRLEVQSIGRG